MATHYRVTAPYVTLKVKDHAGADVVIGYYEGAVVSSEDVNADSLKHHLEGEMIEKITAAEVPDPGPTKEETEAAQKAAAKKAGSSS